MNTLHVTLYVQPLHHHSQCDNPDSRLSPLSRTSCRPSPLMSSGFSACVPTTGQVSLLPCAWAACQPGVSLSRQCGCFLSRGGGGGVGGVVLTGDMTLEEPSLRSDPVLVPRRGFSSQSPQSCLPIYVHVTETNVAQEVLGQHWVEPVWGQGPYVQAALWPQHWLPLCSRLLCFRVH